MLDFGAKNEGTFDFGADGGTFDFGANRGRGGVYYTRIAIYSSFVS